MREFLANALSVIRVEQYLRLAATKLNYGHKASF